MLFGERSSEPVKRFETPSYDAVCATSSRGSGSLIHATVGSSGGGCTEALGAQHAVHGIGLLGGELVGRSAGSPGRRAPRTAVPIEGGARSPRRHTGPTFVPNRGSTVAKHSGFVSAIGSVRDRLWLFPVNDRGPRSAHGSGCCGKPNTDVREAFTHRCTHTGGQMEPSEQVEPVI